MELQLVYNFKQGEKDVSDLLRGKIQMLDEFLEIKNVFDRYATLQKTVTEEEEKQKKGAS